MDKEQFNRLTVIEQIEEFNKAYEIHKSIRKVCSVMGLSKTTVRDRFKSVGYSFIEGQGYIRDINIPVEDKTSFIEPVCENKHDSNITEDELENKINAIIERKIKELTVKHSDRDITLSKQCTGEVKYSSYGVYKDVSEMFSEFVKEHKRFSKIEIVSQALLEFMQNHKD